ncbi:hypothetical protein KKH23_04280 [Patescibacteria group bacterium]|nr:hypothetical protein [Patescibacteria group bacterium]MBU0846383.1 hypothetical protein [Patescibacteria group bacterium]
MKRVKQLIKDKSGTPMGHVRYLLSYHYINVTKAIEAVKKSYLEVDGYTTDITILSDSELRKGIIERESQGTFYLSIIKWVCDNNPMSIVEAKDLVDYMLKK